ncbi:hypothetical protein GUITHDRAFT_114019 [Guillardia theta CCMP2712]|uniref:Amino acid transporter transmembrane domain-containing protein n=1 Tax=Guillardia theta (strain CCMP2712) TaxID=905079 RepID=L1IUM0_GUITC|nr:hypothetical protein GUITHDRAFT_114019 [Guillardia theta CCMP2712]EKX39772.1 hypothetical protein GUITHDRAFT_114019 [Guillardia theta CCMP2712]|eukprot:XP_005826752.1 hypothetical protein GUITHDRAFT_114019 [Guillardia theta CCMP2712]
MIVLLSLLAIIGMGAGQANFSRLLVSSFTPHKLLLQMPIMLQILMYLQVVPTVCSMLNGKPDRIRIAVLVGSLLPLLVCLLWSAVGIALVPSNGGALSMDPVDFLLSQCDGSSILPTATGLIAFAAIGTTLIGIYLIIAQYLHEILVSWRGGRRQEEEASGKRRPGLSRRVQVQRDVSRMILRSESAGDVSLTRPHHLLSPSDRVAAALLASVPPLLFALGGESVYIIALAFAGAYPLCVMWGLAPPFLLSSLRNKAEDKRDLYSSSMRLFPGGGGSFLQLSGFALLLMLVALTRDLRELLLLLPQLTRGAAKLVGMAGEEWVHAG